MVSVRMEIKWAVIFTLSGLIWMGFEKLMGWHDEHFQDQAIYTNLYALVAIAVYVLALYDKRNNYYGGIMTWRQGFKSGLLLTLFVTLMAPLAQYITSTYITPEYFDKAIAYAVQSGNSTAESAESYFNLKNYVIYATAGALIMGIITSAVVALFIKRN